MLIDEFRELIFRFDIIIFLLTLEIALILIKQWIGDRKRKLENVISLSFGVFTAFLALGILTYIIRRYYFKFGLMFILPIESPLSRFLFEFSIFLMGIGAISFIFTLEYKISHFLRTKFILTTIIILLLPILILSSETPFFLPILLILAGSAASFIFLFMVYLIKNSLGNIKNKISLGTIALLITIIGLMGMSDRGIMLLYSIFHDYRTPLIICQFIVISSLSVLLTSFFGFSLILEAQWRGNLISLHIIDKKNGKEIYTKEFLVKDEHTVFKGHILAHGMKSIIDIVNQISESDKSLKIIDKEDMKIIIDYGEQIISVLFVKTELFNIEFFLHEITKEFERNFSQCYDLWSKSEDIFKPMDKIIEKIVPQL